MKFWAWYQRQPLVKFCARCGGYVKRAHEHHDKQPLTAPGEHLPLPAGITQADMRKYRGLA